MLLRANVAIAGGDYNKSCLLWREHFVCDERRNGFGDALLRITGSVDYAIKFMKMSATYVRERLSQQCLYIFFVGIGFQEKCRVFFQCLIVVLERILLQFMRHIDNNHIFVTAFIKRRCVVLKCSMVMVACM